MGQTQTIRSYEYAAEPGHTFQEKTDGPWLTVVSSRGWWCDEPLSFGKLDGEDGYIYDWSCRLATDEEIKIAVTRREEATAKAEAERTEKRARRQAEQDKYKSELDFLRDEWESLVKTLSPTEKTPSLKGYSAVKVGSACEPGRGASCVTELIKYVDTEGRVVAVAYGEPCGDMGMRYWVNDTISKASNAQYRLSQWWKPGTYGADSYPGPGVPLEELTEAERVMVDEYFAAKRADLIKRQAHSWQSWLSFNGGGKVEATETELRVTTTDGAAATDNLYRWNKLNEDRYSACYQKSPLPVVIEELPAATETRTTKRRRVS